MRVRFDVSDRREEVRTSRQMVKSEGCNSNVFVVADLVPPNA
jgi:hypothetical protein